MTVEYKTILRAEQAIFLVYVTLVTFWGTLVANKEGSLKAVFLLCPFLFTCAPVLHFGVGLYLNTFFSHWFYSA